MYHTSKQYLFILSAGFALVFLSCFAPLKGDEGSGLLTIGTAGRTAISAVEAPDLSYDISLTGPGGELSHHIPRGQVLSYSASVLPGLWTVVVRAYNSLGVLRGTGYDRVVVAGGTSAEAQIKLTTTTAVYNYTQLDDAIEAAQGEELILVCGNIELDTGAGPTSPPPSNTVITIAADSGTRTLIRGSSFTPGDEFFDVTDFHLVLGVPGSPVAAGNLVLDGGVYYSGTDAQNALIVVAPGSKLTMNDNTTLQNNENTFGAGGAVTVNSLGEFIMNGGLIYNNSTAGAAGGGVYADSNAPFTMNGGVIRKNTAPVTSAQGGGVFTGGSFTMNGGLISENSAAGVTSEGGGVYLNNSFTMKGGLISGNHAENGGGVYGNSGTTLTMKGGTISANTAVTNGAGVFASSGLSMEGNALVDPNNAVYLPSPGTTLVTITGDLSHNPVANIKGSFTPLLTFVLGGNSSLIARNYWRFLVNGSADLIDVGGLHR
jgi:hypothetical protein